eukprot:scaffold196163_cov15-Prasinocladus_malaysianus.AAC.1
MQGKLGKEKKPVECRQQATLLRYIMVMHVLFNGFSGYLSSNTDYSRADRNCRLGYAVITVAQMNCKYN